MQSSERITAIAGLLFCACLTIACGGNGSYQPEWGQPRSISRADFADNWPFTVERGQLRCDLGNHVVFLAQGKTYAINGSAKGAASKNGYADASVIIAPGPYRLSAVIDAGLKMCP